MRTASEPKSPSPRTQQDRIDDALARAVVWRQVAVGFSPPDGELDGDADRRALAAAARRLGLPPSEPGCTDDLDVRFAELFGHTVRATVCPYETEYGAGRVFQQTRELADLRGWYGAFGLDLRHGGGERADHLAVECEFAGFLCQKEALALAGGDSEQAEITREAYRRFLRDHLARFGIAVTGKIEQVDGGGFYGRLAVACRNLLLAECQRLDVEAGPRALPLRPDTDDDVAAACGSGADGEIGECEGASPLGRSAPRRLLSIGGEG